MAMHWDIPFQEKNDFPHSVHEAQNNLSLFIK